MTRDEIYREIEEEFGLVPTFLKAVPDTVLEQDWLTMKALDMQEGLLSLKVKHLIGLGVAAAIKCRYCTLYHHEMAKLFGATDHELHEALRYAMSATGWSTFLNGLELDWDEFKREMEQIKDYVVRRMETVETVAI
ncbi:MAG: carboxymuconolactone decarboxylase family protein [Armatimonadota bacterium]|nr:carboxymuconolactone decarboxylase family protein [Armatimonadota bacterium]